MPIVKKFNWWTLFKRGRCGVWVLWGFDPVTQVKIIGHNGLRRFFQAAEAEEIEALYQDIGGEA